ncbi:MAG: hypothetical protein ACK54H_11705, partial [Phycisphaerales bacterium]
TPVVSVSTPLSRLDSIRERMRMLQPDLAMPHEDVVVGGFEGVTMRTPISREGDREVTLMFVLCFKPTPEICITITAFGAERHGTSFRSACDSILNNSKIVEVR